MAGVEVTMVGVDEVSDYIDKIPGRLFDESKKAFQETAALAHRKVSERIRDGAGDTLHSRTGALRRSMLYEVHGTNMKTLGSSVHSSSRYPPIHEYGGTVTAKNAYHGVPGGPYLNIPSSQNKTPAGVQRLGAREVFAGGGYIRPISNGRYAVFLAGVPMFWLVRQVRIPARLEMIKTAEDEVPTLLSKLRDATGEAIQ